MIVLKMAEISVQIKKDIEELSSSHYQLYHQFLKLVNFFYVERSENIDYSNCYT